MVPKARGRARRRRNAKRVAGLAAAFSGLLCTSIGLADTPPERPPEEVARPLVVMATFEVRPPPRAGLVLEHALTSSARLAHALTFGFGTFPDAELRTGFLPAIMTPAYPWLAFRIRRIDLDGLPPVENYLTAGIGFASDSRRRISFDAGAGVRFQLPPLAAEPAGDAGAYFAENIHAEVRFGLRVGLW